MSGFVKNIWFSKMERVYCSFYFFSTYINVTWNSIWSSNFGNECSNSNYESATTTTFRKTATAQNSYRTIGFSGINFQFLRTCKNKSVQSSSVVGPHTIAEYKARWRYFNASKVKTATTDRQKNVWSKMTRSQTDFAPILKWKWC